REARDAFNDTPLPRRGLHLWRYTDPATFLVPPDYTDTAFTENADRVERSLHDQVSLGHLAAAVIDFGGRDIKTERSAALDEQGVVIIPLSEAVETHHDLVSAYLYRLINSNTGKFEAMNGALWNDGIFIHVPDNQTVEYPIHLLREAGGAGSVQYPRLLVIVGRNAELTLIDEYGGGSDNEDAAPAYANSAVEIFGQADSRVTYVSLQRHAVATNAYLTHRAHIERNAVMQTIPLAFGGATSKQNFGVILDGPGADSRMYGLLFGSGYQHFDNHTLHHHAAGQTTSNIDFKVVLRDRAISAYTGLIRIDTDAKNCEAFQENRNLLLTPGTKAETIPELEILNEDVSCSHGATVGPLDPELVFYLMCRGIPQHEAVRMLVSGFVADTLRMSPDNLRDRLTDFVTTRLEGI
ncbi:MAG: Fe-S cluster assembly protein SufD, partial [Candidatus Zixiibacteriota bacterium]